MSGKSPSPQDLLRTAPPFAALDDRGRAAVLEHMRRVQFPGGRLVFSRGDPATDLFLVLEGRIRLSLLTAEGRELSLAHALVGDVFGEIGVLDGAPRTADATAIVDTHALALSRAAFTGLLRTEPSLVDSTIRLLCQRLRHTDGKLEAIAMQPIETRLARYLLSEVDRQVTGSTAKRHPLRLGMSQGELAMLLGATRPKVNAAMRALEGMRCIERQADGAVACDIGLLSDIAGGRGS